MSYDEEYYCPNCGATLNDQYGFDPDKGSWTCTECGQHLMDDDVYNGDTYEGVAWYCDECGALLNKQSGFSDSYGSWTCTECGHTNGTTEDDIIDDDKISCPNCGADLSSEYSYDCTCYSCGAKLHRDYTSDAFEEVEDEEEEDDGPECPNCGAKLKSQWSYNDWNNDYTCSDCGANLHRDYSSDDFEIVEEDDDDNRLECPNCGAKLSEQDDYDSDEEDWTCSECGTHLHHDYSDDEYEIVEEDDEEEEEEKTSHSSYTTYKSGESKIFTCPSCGATLSKQYGFDYKNEEYTCKVCHSILYHNYTDEPYKIRRERTTTNSSATSSTSRTYSYSQPPKSSYSSPTSNRTTYTNSYRSSKEAPNEWLLFFMCLFLGYFGVHKFMEGKVGMGLLYLFTFGLCGIGWMIDTCKHFFKAIGSIFR